MTAKQQGFTLFEVLIALVIFAMVATTMTLAIDNASASARALEQRIYARWVSEDTMNKIRLQQIPAANSVNALPMGGYQFQVQITAYPAISERFNETLTRVRIDVTHSDNPERMLHSLVGLVAQ